MLISTCQLVHSEEEKKWMKILLEIFKKRAIVVDCSLKW